MILNGVIARNFHAHPGRVEYDVVADFDAHHREFEPTTLNLSFMRRWLRIVFFLDDRLVIAVLGNYSIVNGLGDVVEYIECHLGRYVEKFAVLTDSQICQAVNGFMNQFLNLVEFHSLHCGENLKRQGHSRVVKFL